MYHLCWRAAGWHQISCDFVTSLAELCMSSTSALIQNHATCSYMLSGCVSCCVLAWRHTDTTRHLHQVGRGPGEVEAEDVTLAIDMKARHSFVPRPNSETLQEIASQVWQPDRGSSNNEAVLEGGAVERPASA